MKLGGISAAAPGTEVSDGLDLANGAHHVVIDHCSLSGSVDEGFDVGWSNPTGQRARAAFTRCKASAARTVRGAVRFPRD